jgi:hypothetical protein
MSIRAWARQHLAADPHGAGAAEDEYRITTIYFDSPEYDVFHRRRSFGRSKYRIRRYGDGGEVFLERKLRQPGLLAKRRTLVPLASLARLDDGDAGWPGRWFQRRLRLRHLRPVCQISYTRVARVGETAAGPVRLTLDEGLSVARLDRVSFEPGGESVDLLGDQMVLELKYRVEVPALFKQLVEEFGLKPQAVSKYRLGIAAIDPDATREDVSAPVASDAVSGLPCA